MKRVLVITPAKTGTATFLKTCESYYETEHSHDLNFLKDVLIVSKNNIIITGIRDPIARNLSYFFQTYKDDFYNGFKIKENNYEGEYCYVDNMPTDVRDIIDVYFNKTNQYSYNSWLKEFIEITNIKSFDKEKGLQIYNLKNNNTLILYTLEKLNYNEKEILNYLDIDSVVFGNINKNKTYQKVRSKIKYNVAHLNKLLFTKEMKFFYTDKDLEKLFNKYNSRKIKLR